MTRAELTAALRDLPEDEKLDLLSEIWESLDHSTPPPDWHKEELDRRLASSDTVTTTSWSDAKARILGMK